MLSSRNLSNLNRAYSKIAQTKFTRNNFSSAGLSNPVFLKDKYSQFSLQHLNDLSKCLSQNLLKNLDRTDLKGERIAVLCSNNYTYMISLMAIWQANGVPLGLNKQYPANLLEYFLNDSKCKLVINGISPDELTQESDKLASLLDKQKVFNFKLVENEYFKSVGETTCASSEESLGFFRGLLNKDFEKEALILYTSGTR